MVTPTLNKQPVEVKDHHKNGFLEVHHLWETIQGEGPFSGMPACFIRLAGCNLQCPLCDTDYTSRRTTYSPASLVQAVKMMTRHRLVVFTGGEPLRQNLVPAIRQLAEDGYIVQIETNGTLWNEGLETTPALVVCSPKASHVHKKVFEHVLHWKYVVQEGRVGGDGLPNSVLGADIIPARPNKNTPPENIYIQPCDEADPGRNAENRNVAVSLCLHWGFRLCLQTHKLVGLE